MKKIYDFALDNDAIEALNEASISKHQQLLFVYPKRNEHVVFVPKQYYNAKIIISPYVKITFMERVRSSFKAFLREWR